MENIFIWLGVVIIFKVLTVGSDFSPYYYIKYKKNILGGTSVEKHLNNF